MSDKPAGGRWGRGGRRVEWDEDNLEKNAEYQRLHPVTMHIDEPKTPYVHMDDDVAAAMDRGEELTWDPRVNLLAHKVRMEVAEDRSGCPVAPVDKNGRPMLHPATATGELEEKLKEKQFRKMRQAVYADEGAKFKALLAQQKDEDDDDDDDDGNGANGKGRED